MIDSAATLLVNGNIRTVDNTDSVVQAVLVENGAIVAVGSEREVAAKAPPAASRIDLLGRTVIPGIIDPHNHLSVAAFEPLAVDCAGMSDLVSVLDAIENKAAQVVPGQWIRVVGFFVLHVAERRGPTRGELDEAAPDNPVFVIDLSCHMGYANSRALADVGIDGFTPQPWGGEIVMGPDGLPTGELFEAATNLLHSASWIEHAHRDPSASVAMLNRKMLEYMDVGITGVGDAMVTREAAELYRRADDAGALPFTVQQLHHGDHFFAMQDLRRYDIVEQIREQSSRMLRGGSLKIFFDRGYPDGPTMREVQDGCLHHTGSAFYSRADLEDLVERARVLGIRTAVHAMGSYGVDVALDAYETRRRSGDEDSTLRIEHAFVADPRQGERLAELNVDLVANPGLGPDTASLFSSWRPRGASELRILPVRSMIDAGVRVSFGSDHPCGSYSPFETLWAAVTRRASDGDTFDASEAITPAEGLRAMTINPAHASSRADEEGSIEVGKRANFAVLDRDILTCATDEIRSTNVLMTFVDGTCRQTSSLSTTGM
nr:amidohydrolase [uncultured Rhodococcus sp.]